MIRFVTTRWHAYTLAPATENPLAPMIELLHYDRLLASRRFPRRTHVFTDLDRLPDFDLELTAAIYRRLAERGVPVLNDPARVKSRFALLRALHEAGINDFNVYRVDERVRPERFPVFVRNLAGHERPLTGLLEDWDAVRVATEELIERGVPSANLLMVEYAGEPVVEGLFRKLSHWRIGDFSGPGSTLHDPDWNVKRGKRGIAPKELYEDALRIVREDPFGELLQRVFEIARIDYGRADFGLVRGRPQIYEINTNPVVPAGKDHPSPAAVEAQRLVRESYYAALHRLDRKAASGWPVRIRDPLLHRYRGRRILGPRSRRMP